MLEYCGGLERDRNHIAAICELRVQGSGILGVGFKNRRVSLCAYDDVHVTDAVIQNMYGSRCVRLRMAGFGYSVVWRVGGGRGRTADATALATLAS